MASIKGGGSSGGGSSSSKSSGGGGNRSIHPSKSVEDKHPKGQGWATQPGALAPNGQRSDSYTRQNIADKKSNRNFLAETAEESIGERRSNNEYQKQKEKTRFLDEAQGGREAAEKKAQDKAVNDYQLKQKDDSRQKAQTYLDEADRLEQEKTGRYGYNPVATNEEEAAAIADTDRQIADLRSKADEELSKVNTTNSKRDAAVEEYLKAVEAERTIADGATILNQAELDAASADRKQKEEALKELNHSLGNDEYFGLVDEAQSRDLFEGWAGERAAGSAAALGTGMEWLGDKLSNVSLAAVDPETGEEREVWSGRDNALTDAGSTLFNAAQGWQGQAQEDWSSGTSNMSDTEKQIAGLGKTAADMTMDMIENFIVPGSGRVMMGLRSAGQGALTQAGRENNDIDTRMAKAAFDGVVSWLTEYAMGGAEAVYGKSVFGKAIKPLMEKLPSWASPVLKTVLNTEGVQEVMEYGLTYLGDKYLGFDRNAQYVKDEAKENFLVGYIMGVIFNGVAGGLNYDAPKMRAVVDEAVTAYESGKPLGEIQKEALLQPDENVRTNVGKQIAEPEAEAKPEMETVAEPEPIEETQETPTPFNNSMDNGEQSEWHTFVRDTLSSGAVNEADIDKIIKSREGRQAFSDVTGIPLKGKSEAEVRRDIGMAAGSVPTQVAESLATPAPEGPMRGSQQRRQLDWLSPNPTISNIQELGTVTPRQAAQIRNNPELRAAFEEAYGVSLEGLGEKAAINRITNAVTGARANDVAVEAWESERGAIPAAEPSFANEGPGEKGSKDWKEYKRATKARQDVADILAGTELTRKDAIRLMNDEIMWAAFQDATGISLGKKPKTEQNVRDAFREAKANMPEPETEVEAEAETEIAEPQTTEETAQAPATETTAETDANEEETEAAPAQEETATEEEPQNPEPSESNAKPEQNESEGEQQEKPKTRVARTSDILAEVSNPRGTKKVLTKGSGKEKVSKYYSNTMTKTGEAADVEPIVYNVKSESESIANAVTRLEKNYKGMIDHLVKAEAWSGEMTDAAAIIAQELRKEARRTGDKTAYTEWKKIQSEKQRESARGIQAIAKQSRPGSEAVFDSINKEIEAVRRANKEAKAAGKKEVVPEETLKKAEKKAEEISDKMLDLEIEIDEKIESGMGEAEARESTKEAYLDLIDEINAFRHTGLIQDAKVNDRMRKSSEKLQTKFRKMLSEEGMDYIQRFSAVDAAGISEDIHYDEKNFLKRLNTFQKLAQLTGTGTWLRNGVGNGSFGIVDVLSADNPITLLTDLAVSKNTGKRSSGFETGIGSKRARDAAAHALNRSILEVAANIDLAEGKQTKYDMSKTRAYDPDGKAIQRAMSRWEQWNGYMLQSSDAWFKGMAEGSAEAAIRKANKWGKDNLTETEKARLDPVEAKKLSKRRQAELDDVKRQIAEYRTFQNDGWTAEQANKLRDAMNVAGNAPRKWRTGKDWQKGEFGLGTALMPYTKVPTNLGVKALEFSPAGAAKGVAEILKVVSDPKATMAQQNKAVTDFGRGMTGTMLIYGLAKLMKRAPFFKDWENEDDKDVKAQNKAEGKSGMQFNLSMIGRFLNGDKNPTWENGDRTVDISSMEPVNQLITTASLIAEQEDLTAGGAVNAFLQSAHDSLNQLPSLQTLSNIENTIRYTDTPDDLKQTLMTTGASTVGSIAGGFIPAPLKHATTASDKYVRDTSGNNQLERAVNQAKSGIPGLRTTLPVKRDAFGNVMTSGDVGTRIANQYSPFKHSQVNQSDVSRELEKVRKATDEVLVPARNPVKKIKYPDGTLTFSNKDAKDYQALVGKEQELRLKDLFATDLYKNSTPALKAQMIQEVEKFAKDTGKTALAEAFDISFDSDYKDVRNLKDPVDFLMTKTGYNAVTKAEKWDSVDALLKTVRQGKLSDSELDFYEDHIPGFKKMYSMAGSGVGSQRVTDFANALQTQYEKEKRTDARGSDYIKVLGSGKFTAKEADALMDYAPDVKQSTIDKYHEQVNYQLKKAGMSGSSAEVWKGIEQVVNGELDKSKFNKWVDQNVPLQQRQEIKDICSNYAKDRHEAGKTVSSIYKSVREAGFTPQQALEFYEAIDKNYNGSMTKKEYKNALRKVFGNKDGERIWNNMRKHGVQYVTGRF